MCPDVNTLFLFTDCWIYDRKRENCKNFTTEWKKKIVTTIICGGDS